jgi:hypothetical protein
MKSVASNVYAGCGVVVLASHFNKIYLFGFYSPLGLHWESTRLTFLYYFVSYIILSGENNIKSTIYIKIFYLHSACCFSLLYIYYLFYFVFRVFRVKIKLFLSVVYIALVFCTIIMLVDWWSCSPLDLGPTWVGVII